LQRKKSYLALNVRIILNDKFGWIWRKKLKEQNISACIADRYSSLGPPKYILHCCLFNDAIGSLNYITFNVRKIIQKLTDTDVGGNSCRLAGVTRTEVV
jgi:hypothetical protein